MREAGAGGPRSPTGRALELLALALLCALPFLRFARQEAVPSWGWDESMHAELPAARMLLSVREGHLRGAADALLDCQQYPFAYPLALAASQAVFGISEAVARWTTVALTSLMVLGLFLLGRELQRLLGAGDPGEPSRRPYLPLLLAALPVLSPLVARYSGTLFLELPFTCAATFAVRAWLRRGAGLAGMAAARRELAAGFWVTAAFFTKFNYGLLLGGALVIDWLAATGPRWLRGERRELLPRGLWLALLPAAGCLWWFGLPLPGGLQRAAEHREAFLGFVRGNLQMGRVGWQMRVVDLTSAFAPSVALLWILALGLPFSLRLIARPVVRTLWILMLVTWVPAWLHPFHLDRFLLPGGLALWCLAAIGWYDVIPGLVGGSRRRQLSALLVAILLSIGLGLGPGLTQERLAERLGLLQDDEETRAYQLTVIGDWIRGRGVPTAGLGREEARAVIDLVSAEVGADERFGWIGLSTEMSPAALHLGLLARGGSVRRFLRDIERPLDVTPVPGAPEPDWDLAAFERFASGFDVLFLTEPPDLKGRTSRQHVRARWQEPLVEQLGWEANRIGQFLVLSPRADARVVGLYACRRP